MSRGITNMAYWKILKLGSYEFFPHTFMSGKEFWKPSSHMIVGL